MSPTPPRQPADQAERTRAIEALDTCLLVEAAAGTGKTTLLVNRVMALLRAGKAALSQIAAITFTEKAAGELKMRLRQAVEKELRQSEGAASETMRRALSELDGMSVSTIHRFCADLIRERPVEAGVDPQFKVCDALQQALLFDEAWDEWIARQMHPDNTVLRRALEIGIRVERGQDKGATLPSLASLLINHRDLSESLSLAPKRPEEDLATLATRIRNSISGLAEARTIHCTSPDSDNGSIQIAELERWSAAFASNTPNDLLAWVGRAPRVNAKSGSQKNWASKSALKEVKEQFAELKEAAEGLREELYHCVISDLTGAVQPFAACYEKRKQQARALDFADLLIVARDMLAGSKPARDYFKRRFTHLLVDEFQDTDPLQAEVVFYLSEQPGQHAASWDEVALEPGKLFIVGDPKQSIYRFRRADLDLYGRVKDIFAQQGEVLRLSVNFRSVPEILTEANAIFNPLMTGPTKTRFEPEHVPLVPYRDSSGKGPAVTLLPPPPNLDIKTLKADDWRRKELGCIAAYIKQSVSDRMALAHKDGERPLRYGDVAILYRYTTGLAALEEALRAHEVPYQVSGGKHYYDRMEFQSLLCVLRALENPFDAANVVGALRSPFFGLSDGEILSHFLSAGSLNYVDPQPSQSTELADAFQVLADLHRRRTEMPPAALLTDLFERTQAVQLYALKPHGRQRVANLLKLRDMAQTLSESGVSSFGGMVRRLAEFESADQAESESPVAEQGEDIVQVLTIHKAKGLQFPMVVLANLGQQERNTASHVLDRATHQLSLNFGMERQTRDWETALATEKDREEHEMIRLFYVAMTRAEDRLVIPAYWWQKPDQGFLGYLNRRYTPDEHHMPSCDSSSVQVLDTSGFDLDKRSLDRFRARPELRDTLPAEAEEFWLHRRNWHASLQERANQLNDALDVVTATGEMQKAEGAPSRSGEPTSGDSHATAFGSFVHSIMERIDFHATGEAVLALAQTLAHSCGLSQEDARLGSEMVNRALAHPLIRDHALAASEMHREVPFTAVCNGALHEGVIDLIYVENDEAVIVDYKTNNVTAEEAAAEAEKYRPQAEVYVRAMREVLDIPVRRVVFLFVRPDVSKDIFTDG